MAGMETGGSAWQSQEDWSAQLADLAAAAALVDSQPDDTEPMPGGNDENKDANGSGILPTSLAAVYARANQAEPHPAHLAALAAIPQEICVKWQARGVPRARAGGAVVSFPASGGEPMLCAQLKAFLECQNAAGDIVMLDHLGLSDNALPTGALASLVQSACLLRPWWRLRSLAVARCGLALEGFLALATPEAGPAVKHLARLDLSGNGAVGRAPSGQLVSAEELLASGHLLLMHLWRNAPLRFVDLTGTGGDVAQCLGMSLCS